VIELKTSYSLSGIPYITYDALDEYAETVVADFAPELLRTPGILNVEKFLEYYLGLSIRYCQINYDRKILGMTAFNDGLVQVINEETGLPESIYVTKGTVIFDTSLALKRSKPRLSFTGMHEGTHWMIHPRAFAEDNPFGLVGAHEHRYLAAKEGNADYSRSMQERTDIELMERQADFLSSAMLIPRSTLRIVCLEYFRFYGEKPHRIVKGAGNPMDDCFAAQLPEYVAGIFGVSKGAAQIRLEKLGEIVDKTRWRRARL